LWEIKLIVFSKVLQQVKGRKINAEKHFVNNQILLLHLFLTNLDDSNLQKWKENNIRKCFQFPRGLIIILFHPAIFINYVM